jgi:drug/metabolite transporter (DMT)-like permease
MDRVIITDWRVWMRACLMLGVLGIAVQQASMAYAVTYASPIVVSLLAQTVPLVTCAIAMARQQEPFSIGKIAGMAVAACGCACMILDFIGGRPQAMQVSPAGLVAICVNIASSVVYLFLQKWYFDSEPHAPPLTTTAISFVGGSICLALCCVIVFLGMEPHDQPLQALDHPSAIVIVAMLYGGLISSCAVFAAGNYGIRWSDPSFNALFMPVQPIATAFFSVLAFGTAPTVSQYVGGAMVVCAVSFVLFLRRREWREMQRLKENEAALARLHMDEDDAEDEGLLAAIR